MSATGYPCLFCNKLGTDPYFNPRHFSRFLLDYFSDNLGLATLLDAALVFALYLADAHSFFSWKDAVGSQLAFL